jgi:hypothetical protein
MFLSNTNVEIAVAVKPPATAAAASNPDAVLFVEALAKFRQGGDAVRGVHASTHAHLSNDPESHGAKDVVSATTLLMPASGLVSSIRLPALPAEVTAAELVISVTLAGLGLLVTQDGVRLRGKMAATERHMCEAFIAAVVAGEIKVCDGTLAKELRAAINVSSTCESGCGIGRMFATQHSAV